MPGDNRIKSSGNVFKDIGLEYPEEYKTKSILAILIEKFIKEKGYTQKQAAEVLGIDQPRVSRLVRGLLDEFSIERLMIYLTIIGYDVEIKIEKKPKSRKLGKIKVAA